MLALGLMACGSARRFPEAPILIVCPWAAGGGSDRVARQVAILLEQDLGVPVNDYHVCSDRVCYPPASLPLRWTITIRPLDSERSPEDLRHRDPKLK